MSAFPTLVDPDDLGRGPLIVGLTWTFAALAILAVVLRFYVRITLSNGLGLDDWLMGAALACNIVSQSFVTASYHYGLGKHDNSLTIDQMINVLKWMWLANTPGLLVAILARLSIAVLLIRLFGTVHFWLKWFLIIITSLCTVLTLVILPCTYLQSTPVSGNWDTLHPAKHWNPQIYISLAFLGQALWTLSDLTFVLLPIMVIWRLQMALRQRIGLVTLMSMSIITMVLSILKTVWLQKIADQQTDPTATDVQYNASLTILYSCIEQAFVIIMGCVPPLRAIVRLELPKSLGSSLASILRRGRPSKSSGQSSLKYDASAGPYESLEMSNGGPYHAAGKPPSLPFQTVAAFDQGRQPKPVGAGDVLATTKTSISYSQWHDIV